MPCCTRSHDRNELKTELEQHKKYAMQIEAAMCAVFNELERRGIINEVLAHSSRDGLINIVSWWDSHKSNDESRIAREIHKYSKDEQRLILNMLKAQYD